MPLMSGTRLGACAEGRRPPASREAVIHLDTSALLEALTGPKRQAARLRALIDQGERITFSTLVLYEWLRGSRTRAEPKRVGGTGNALAGQQLARLHIGSDLFEQPGRILGQQEPLFDELGGAACGGFGIGRKAGIAFLD